MRLKIILGYTIEYILFACYKDANVFLGYSYVWACAFWGIKGVKVVHSHPNGLSVLIEHVLVLL